MRFGIFLVLLFAPLAAVLPAAAGINLTVTLPQAGLATVVIEDAEGNRIRNLLAETPLTAGRNTLAWDGYDDGAYDSQGNLVRHRVPPGVYHLRGLVHGKIVMRYEFPVNSPGTPPWKTADGSGGWLADHTPPADILFLPLGVSMPNGKGQAHLLVCSTSGESGEEFVWLSSEGRRLYGVNTGFWGGVFLARDLGPNPVPSVDAYTFTSGERDGDNNTLEVRGFEGTRLRTVFKTTFPMEWKKDRLPTFASVQEGYGTDGLAVYNGRIVLAMTHLNQLIVAKARTHTEVAQIPLSAPRGLAFDSSGRLYAITNRQVKRLILSQDGTSIQSETTVVASGLADPRRLSLDAQNNLYVSDWGKNHQIKVFTPSGQLARVIGKPGGPQLGLYDLHRLQSPCGVTIDGQNRMWIAEADSYPKRLSLWNTDGTFLKAWYGGPKYGGGGAIDATNPTRFFYAEYEHGGGTEFTLDWKAGTYRPEAVYWRPEATPQWDLPPGPAPEHSFKIHGFTYLVNCYNGQLRENQDRGIGIWRLDRDHIARPVVLISDASDLNHSQWGWPMKNKDALNALWQGKDQRRVFFVWSDTNDDHVAQPEEVQFIVSDRKDADGNYLSEIGLMPLVQPDLSITTSYGTYLPPPTVDSRGIPHYDLSKLKIVGNPNRLRSPLLAGGWTLADQDGIDATLGADIDGKRLWRYNHTPEARLGGPGLMVSPSRILGPPVTPTAGEAGPLVAITGEKGELYLLTLDGLFLQSLGGDARVTPLWRDPALFRRGALIEGVSFEDEHFHPTLNQLHNGQIYLAAGKEHSSLLHLEGFETVKRLDFGPVTVSSQTQNALPETQTEAARTTERNLLTVPITESGPIVDGDLTDWPATTNWTVLDSRASATLRVDGTRLYAAYRTHDPQALDNGSGDIATLFKRGGALDLMIGSNPQADPKRQSPVPGDERLLVTQEGGAVKAVLYRAVVPGTTKGNTYEYASPIGRVDFDQVTDISRLVQLASKDGNFEFSVPLSVLGLTPSPGTTILGDLGLLRGSGGQTTQRLYWNNGDTLLVSDLPSEARLTPARWGFWRFQ